MGVQLKNGQTILFIGDSITDCGRDRTDANSLGTGYPAIIAQRYLGKYPDSSVTFLNRGISGDRVHDLIIRYGDDIFDIEPDFICILIGINDVWRRYDSNDPSTISAFTDHYEFLLGMIKSHMPDTKIMMMEPFLLHSMPERIQWREDLDPKRVVVEQLAKRFADYYVPLDEIMRDAVAGGLAPDRIAGDSVHPSETGHSIIADSFFKALGIDA